MTIVAFQGEHGAYSEEAVRQHFGEEVETLPCASFEQLFESVESGKANYGMVPVENSTAGSINKAYDLLLEHDLKVHGEVNVRVRHHLLTVPGGAKEISEVRSHPQALAQCEGYLNRHRYKAVVWYDTAGSAKDLAAAPVPGVAVIASKLAASHYNLEIVDSGIEDFQHNYTRFFVVGEGDAPASKTGAVKHRCSLSFQNARARYEALGELPSARSISPRSKAVPAAIDSGNMFSIWTVMVTGRMPTSAKP